MDKSRVTNHKYQNVLAFRARGILRRTWHKRVRLSVLALAAFVNATDGHANLMAIDDVNWGIGAIVRDTTTGLEWLKPNRTANQSYDTLQSQLGSGIYTGFRYASLADIAALFTNTGISVGPSDWYTTATFVSVFEPTYSSQSFAIRWIGVSGLFSPSIPGSTVQYANVQYGVVWTLSDTPYGPGTQADVGSIISSYSNPATGNWLVRNHDTPSNVPIPAALWLFGSGLGALGLFNRRHKSGLAT